jgi:hypothetical protein
MSAKLTTSGKPSNNTFTIIFLLFISQHVYLVASTRLYPFLDTPNHLAIATIYRYYGEPTNQFARFYTIDTFLKPNVFHLFFCGSRLFPTVEFANKVFYCLYVTLFPLSILLLIKKLGGNQWFSLLSFLFLYNINVLYGFNGFIIAIPFLMFTFWTMLYYSENRTVPLGCALSILLVLLFFMHALAALFGLLIVCACLLLLNNKSFFGVIRHCMPMLPAGALIAIWWYRDSGQFGGASLTKFLFRYYKGEYFSTIYVRGGFPILDNFRLQDGALGYAFALVFSLFVMGLVVKGLFTFNSQLLKTEIRSSMKPLIILMVSSSAVFLLIPERMPGYSFLFERFSVFIFIALILIGSVLFSHNLKPALKGAICVMCFFHFLLWADYFHDFDKQNKSFNKDFFSSVSNDSTLAGLMFDYRFRGRSVYDNFTDYFIVWKHGIATTRVIDERSFPVKRMVSTDVLPQYVEWAGKYDSYAGQYAAMDYILVRGELSHKAQEHMQDFVIIKQAEPWFLYERKNLKE